MPTILFRPRPAVTESTGLEAADVALFKATPPQAALPIGGGQIARVAAIKHRKDVYDLTAPEIAALRLAFEKVYAISDDRGFQYWAGIHGYPLPIYCQHGTPLFAVWHRPYLYLFEKALQDQVAGVTLPYWDWTSARAQKEGLPKIYTDPTYKDGATVKPNPLAGSAIKFTGTQYPKTTRDPGAPSGLKPLEGQVRKAQARTTYAAYSAALENPHNGLHGWVGGTMGIIPYAAYDPIFWAHHTNIDRLWALWQLNNHPTFPPSFLDRALPPFPMTVRQTLDVSRLGYDYASSTTHATVS
jgi:tyrosinase